MLDLKNHCLHPATSKPYIISTKGGRENSIENSQVYIYIYSNVPLHLHQRIENGLLIDAGYLQNGLTHIFVVEFNNVEDRDYYVRTDPTHRIFVHGARPIIDKIQVVDFAVGVW
jgi:Stress responsive A/B Barrel Domain